MAPDEGLDECALYDFRYQEQFLCNVLKIYPPDPCEGFVEGGKIPREDADLRKDGAAKAEDQGQVLHSY